MCFFLGGGEGQIALQFYSFQCVLSIYEINIDKRIGFRDTRVQVPTKSHSHSEPYHDISLHHIEYFLIELLEEILLKKI